MKFRVWCKDTNSWEKDDCYLDSKGNLFTRQERNRYLLMPISPFTGNHIIEIDTGFKDINGESLFVGDIIRYEDGNCGYGRLRDYYLDGYIYEILYEDTYIDQLWDFYKDRFKTSVEKIGNIHETKITDEIRYWIDDEFREKFQKEHGKEGASW